MGLLHQLGGVRQLVLVGKRNGDGAAEAETFVAGVAVQGHIGGHGGLVVSDVNTRVLHDELERTVEAGRPGGGEQQLGVGGTACTTEFLRRANIKGEVASLGFDAAVAAATGGGNGCGVQGFCHGQCPFICETVHTIVDHGVPAVSALQGSMLTVPILLPPMEQAMSNNVELYAVTPTGDKLEHHCIAVNPYEIPLLFQLLCSHNPQLVPSRTFKDEDALAIISDYAEGKQKVLAFLDRCVELNNQHSLVETEELENMIQQVTTVITQPTLEDCTHVLLESVDVAQMLTSNLKQQLRRDHAEVTRVDAAAEERLIRIFTEAPKQAPTDEEDEFFFPDFDAMSDEEYATYLHDDIEKTELTSTPQENLHRLGFAAFGEFGDYYNFTQ